MVLVSFVGSVVTRMEEGGGKIIIGRRPWGEAISPIVLQKPNSLMQASPPFPQKPLFFAETKVHIRLLQVFSERNYIFFKKISTRDILVFQGIYNYKSVKRQSSLQSDPSFWRWMERTDCVDKKLPSEMDVAPWERELDFY